jgi:hypothetical protein
VIKKPQKMRRLKPATGLWKIQPQWVVMPGKQTNNKHSLEYPIREECSVLLLP